MKEELYCSFSNCIVNGCLVNEEYRGEQGKSKFLYFFLRNSFKIQYVSIQKLSFYCVLSYTSKC